MEILAIEKAPLSQVHKVGYGCRNRAQQLLTDSANASNNLKNLFELPVLFYVAVVLSLSLLMIDQSIGWLIRGTRLSGADLPLSLAMVAFNTL